MTGGRKKDFFKKGFMQKLNYLKFKSNDSAQLLNFYQLNQRFLLILTKKWKKSREKPDFLHNKRKFSGGIF